MTVAPPPSLMTDPLENILAPFRRPYPPPSTKVLSDHPLPCKGFESPPSNTIRSWKTPFPCLPPQHLWTRSMEPPHCKSLIRTPQEREAHTLPSPSISIQYKLFERFRWVGGESFFSLSCFGVLSMFWHLSYGFWVRVFLILFSSCRLGSLLFGGKYFLMPNW